MTLQEAFLTFHINNPRVYDLLVEKARVARTHGFQSYGIAALFELVRWHIHIETDDPEFKLNNNHRSRYARLIMEQEPDLQGFFHVRELMRT